MSASQDLDTRSIAARIKQVRADTGLSQAAFASALGVPFRTVQGYEAGERDVSAAFLDRLNSVFGINPLWLLRGAGHKKSRLGNDELAEILTGLLDRWDSSPVKLTNREKADDFIRVVAFLEADDAQGNPEILDLVARRRA